MCCCLVQWNRKNKCHLVTTYFWSVIWASLVFCSQQSPRKRGGVSADGPGRLPEVKAIQQTRRLLANARERTRVHTISAAFEALRKQVRLTVHTENTQTTMYAQAQTHTYCTHKHCTELHTRCFWQQKNKWVDETETRVGRTKFKEWEIYDLESVKIPPIF